MEAIDKVLSIIGSREKTSERLTMVGRVYGETNMGKIPIENQDCLFVYDSRFDDVAPMRVFAVADGVWGARRVEGWRQRS